MHKIADTTSGNVLIEMSTDEWEYLQRNPDTTVQSAKRFILRTWEKEFFDGLRSLDIGILGIRVYNALALSATVKTIRYEDGEAKQVEPYITRKTAFSTEEGRLLGFNEWCDYVLENPDQVVIRNVGKMGLGNLVQAIKEYKKGC